jgi:alpha-D-ribose 1-methylphosphonate 5-triphosphate synthase subunit PhnG
VVVLPAFRATVSLTDNVATVSFSTIVGRIYRVESKTNLNDASWSPVGEDTLATSTTLTVQDGLAGQPQRFYRLVQVD